MLIGHRGTRAAAPENTIEAFAWAAIHGADAIELDVRMSADGVLVALYDDGVGRTTDHPEDAPLAELTLAELEGLDAALALLSQDARVAVQGRGESARYSCPEFTIGWNDPDGWEAALFDHYQAMVTAICAKLQRGLTHAEPDDSLGGSTYAFDLWQGHPLQEEVLGLPSRLRATAVDLRGRVDDYNRAHDAGGAPRIQVTTYVGQSTRREGESDDD
ncbi:MAG: glycerophosphodiester phosphodiesterase family protein [Myxococcales bacterium]|nr:glycerophosphodiester phosphodiesterase family protein [Myxococcales bacterium]